MTERRYRGTEIEAILARAADRSVGPEAPPSPPRAGGRAGEIPADQRGMTLRELQEIGLEAGISPEQVTVAAASLDHAPEVRHTAGMPSRLRHVAELPRELGEREWQALVTDLRDTFGERGVTREEVGMREWQGSDVAVAVEPTTRGDRLRMEAETEAPIMVIVGGVVALVALVFAALFLVRGELFSDPILVAAIGFLAAIGAGTGAVGAFTLPRWVGRRSGQLEEVATRLSLALRAPPDEGAGPG